MEEIYLIQLAKRAEQDSTFLSKLPDDVREQVQVKLDGIGETE